MAFSSRAFAFGVGALLGDLLLGVVPQLLISWSACVRVDLTYPSTSARGALGVLGGPLGELLRLGARPGEDGLGLGAHLLGGLAGGADGRLGGGPAAGVGLLLLGAAGGEGDLEVADAVVGVRLGLRADPFRLGEPAGDVLGRGAS